MPVNTKTCPHRAPRYATPQDLHADVARLVAAEQQNKLTQHGNWSLGQNLNHLATWVSFAHDGNPLKPPFFIRWLMKGRKQQYLTKFLPRGINIPGVKGGTLATDAMPTAEALSKFNAAWARLQSTAPTQPNPLFGPITHDEWINLHLRHAELHLGFLTP